MPHSSSTKGPVKGKTRKIRGLNQLIQTGRLFNSVWSRHAPKGHTIRLSRGNGYHFLLVSNLLFRGEVRKKVKVGLGVGRRGFARTSALQLDARNAVAQKSPRTQEQLVVVPLLVAAGSDSFESVQVELRVKPSGLVVGGESVRAT